MLTVLSFAGGDAVIDELRGYRPASIDVSPVTLKDIFLESVTQNGGLTCSGTKRGSKRGGASSARW